MTTMLRLATGVIVAVAGVAAWLLHMDWDDDPYDFYDDDCEEC